MIANIIIVYNFVAPLILTLKVLAKLVYRYFKELLKLSRKNGANTNSKKCKDAFFSKFHPVDLDDTLAAEDLNAEDGNSIECACETNEVVV